jgi:hypothetical protein
MDGYIPDENDLDWLAGRPSELVDPNDREKMEWRRAQSAKSPPKTDYSWVIGVIVMAVVILLAVSFAGNNWNPTTGNSPESGAGDCVSGNASGTGC